MTRMNDWLTYGVFNHIRATIATPSLRVGPVDPLTPARNLEDAISLIVKCSARKGPTVEYALWLLRSLTLHHAVPMLVVSVPGALKNIVQGANLYLGSILASAFELIQSLSLSLRPYISLSVGLNLSLSLSLRPQLEPWPQPWISVLTLTPIRAMSVPLTGPPP